MKQKICKTLAILIAICTLQTSNVEYTTGFSDIISRIFNVTIAYAEESGWYSNWTYTIEGNYIWIKEYNGSETTYTIPATATISGITYTTQIGKKAISSSAGLSTGSITKLAFEKNVECLPYLQNLFLNNTIIQNIDLSNLNTESVTNMSSVFQGCSKLEIINVTGICTENVNSMSYMFNGCENIKAIDLSGFNTAKVTTMLGMFATCKKMTNLDISNFSFGNCKDVSYLFTNCENLKTVKIVNLSNAATTVYGMFSGCISLTELDVSSWDTSNVTKMDYLFTRCKALTSIKGIENLNTKNVTTMKYAFGTCSNLQKLDLKKWDVSNVKDAYGLFEQCSNLTVLDVSTWNTEKIQNMGRMFLNCSKIEELDVSNFNTKSAINMINMFNGCSNLKKLDVSKFETNNINLYPILSSEQSILGMFSDCSSLTELDVSNFDISHVDSLTSVFNGCTNLKTIKGIKNWNTENVGTMVSTFYNCTSLQSLDLSNFNTSNVTSLKQMFYGCSSLAYLDISNFDVTSVTNVQDMFYNCTNLKSLQLFENKATSATANNYVWNKTSNNSSLVKSSGWLTKTYTLTPTALERIKLKKGEIFPTTKQKIEASVSGDEYTGNWTALSEYNHTHSSTTLETAYTSISDEEWEANPDGIWFLWEKEGTDPAAQAYTSSDNFYTPEYDADGNLISPSEKFTSDGYWQKIDDSTYSYTFYVYDSTYAWKVYEEAFEGYTSDATVDSPIVISNGDEIATITNTANAVVNQKYGSITIQSSVSDVKGIHSEGSLSYTVTLIDKDGNSITGTQIYGETPFKNGVGRVTVKDGESITIPDIPEGYQYTVVQDGVAYDVSTNYTNQSGTITGDSEALVITETIFAYKASEEVGSSIILSNTVAGNDKAAYAAEEFEYMISFSDLQKGMTYLFYEDASKNTPYISFKADSNGEATVNVALKGDVSICSGELPVGTTYVITQKGNSDTITSVECNSINGNVASSKISNTEAGKDLSTGIEISETSETVLFSFTNTTAIKKDLHFVNEMKPSAGDDVEGDEETEYTITLEGLEPKQALLSNEYGTFVADSDGTVEKTIVLKPGKELVLSNVPSGTKYTITKKADTKYEESVTVNGDTVEAKTNSDKNTYITGKISKTDVETETISWTNTEIKTNTIAVKNNIAGNMGNKTTEFEYAIQFDKDFRASSVIEAYNVEEGRNIAIAIDKNGQAKFSLHGGEELRFSGLTDNEIRSMAGLDSSGTTNDILKTSVGITQVAEADGYNQTLAVDFDEDTSMYTVTYTNTKSAGVPTGNHIGTGIVVVSGISIIGAIYILLKKKKL